MPSGHRIMCNSDEAVPEDVTKIIVHIHGDETETKVQNLSDNICFSKLQCVVLQ